MFLLTRAKRKLVAACLIIGVFLLPLFGPLVLSASAAGTATWVDQATLDYNGVKYKENDAGDANWHFYAPNPDNGCQQEIKDFKNPGYDASEGPFKTQTVKLYKQKKVTGGCSPDGTEDIQLQANPPGYQVAFVWIDDKNIQSADGKKKFSQDADGNFISVTDSSSCKDYMTVGDDKSHPQLVVRSNTGVGDSASISLKDKYRPNGTSGWSFVRDITSAGDININGDRCHESKPVNVTANAANAARPGTSVAPGSSGPGGKDNSCESKGALGWILCPVIEILDGIFNWVDTQIQALLEVNQDAYTNPELYNAWANIRNIAFIVLIPIMLVMVIATALGSDLFSSYTVKKAIPRMVAAILFITLSWYICGFFIGFFNVLGGGVLGLITSPFGLNGKITLGSLFNPSAGGAIVQLGGGTAALALGVFALINVEGLLGILILYFLGAVLVIFLAFLVLVIRQMFILALLLAAPMAILAWIFPGNDKLWKLWWGTFSKLLMMFPLITGLIAVGRVFAYLIGNTPAGGVQGGLLNPLLKITAYIVPYLLIPLTFKFAGGAFATLTGMVNDRSRGIFDRMKKSRQEKVGQMGKNLRAGKLLRTRGDEHSLSNRMNQKLQTASLVGAAGFSVKRQQRSARIEAARSQIEMDEAKERMEKDPAMRNIVKDDDKLWAVMHGTNEAEMRQILKDRAPGRFNETDKKRDLDIAVEEAMRFRKAAGHKGSRIAATMANAATGTGYNYRQDANGNFIGDDDMMTAILDAAGGDASLAGRMLAEMRPMAVQSGRQDIAGGGYAHSMKVMSDLKRARTAPGGVITRDMIDPTTGETMRDAAGNVMTITGTYGIDEARLDIMQDVLRSNAGAAVAGKVKGVKQLAPVLRANAEAALTATGQGSGVNAVRELATLAGKHDAASAVAPQNARVLADEVFSQEISVGTLGPEVQQQLDKLINTRDANGTIIAQRQKITISEAMEHLRDNDDFVTMRREYRQNAQAAAQFQLQQAAAQHGGIQPPVNPLGGINPFGSDRRIKHNIVPLATTKDGIQLYRFQYLWSDQVYVGVMAQDLLQTHPEALYMDANGFYLVDYSALGLEMLTWAEWQNQKKPNSVRVN